MFTALILITSVYDENRYQTETQGSIPCFGTLFCIRLLVRTLLPNRTEVQSVTKPGTHDSGDEETWVRIPDADHATIT